METHNYGLTEDQIAFQQVCRKFVDEIVIPFVKDNHEREWSAPPDERWPKELFQEADKLGLRSLSVPEKYGGMSVDTLTTAIITEELGRGDPGFMVTLGQNWKLARLFSRIAPEHLHDEWFPRYMEDPSFLWANCLTEPRGASDRTLPYNVPEANMDTKAKFENGQWVLNGRKQFISNGYLATLFLVYANTNPDAGIIDGTSCFLVPRGTAGFHIDRANEKLGHRYCINGEMTFDNCILPEDHLLVRDEAIPKLRTYTGSGKVIVSSRAIGVARAAFEATALYVQEQFQGGRILIQHQVIAARLADMATKLETMRALTHHTARARDAGAAEASRLGLMTKLYTVQTAVEICQDAVEIHGGSGCMRELGIEKYLRDALVFLHTEGTRDMHRFKIIKAMFPETAGTYAGPAA